MSYIVTSVTTKPENVQWYRMVDPETDAAANAWRDAQPTLISIEQVMLDSPTNCVSEVIFTFANEADYDTYSIALRSNAAVVTRREYQVENNFVTVTTVVSS